MLKNYWHIFIPFPNVNDRAKYSTLEQSKAILKLVRDFSVTHSIRIYFAFTMWSVYLLYISVTKMGNITFLAFKSLKSG